MKSKLKGALGIGLSAGLVFALIGAVFAGPAVAGEMEWGEITTPSWVDHVIEPGSDIYDYAIASDDGDIVYAVGAINTVDVNGTVEGLSGSFYFHSGTLTLERISDDTASVEGELEGDTCYLRGDFTAILEAWISYTGPLGPDIDEWYDLAVTGVVTGDPDPGDDDDVMEFSGMMYGDMDELEAYYDLVLIDIFDTFGRILFPADIGAHHRLAGIGVTPDVNASK